MTAEIVRFPDVGRPVRTDLEESALIIVLPVIRIERYPEPPKPRVRRKARRRAAP